MMKIVGRKSFVSIDLMCPKCHYEEERIVDLRGLETDAERDSVLDQELRCPNCDYPKMERVWKAAPGSKIGNDYDLHNIERMQKSFRQRYMKKEIDDVKHKFGESVVNEALVSGEANRIKKKLQS
jgi:hypothetical protein